MKHSIAYFALFVCINILYGACRNKEYSSAFTFFDKVNIEELSQYLQKDSTLFFADINEANDIAIKNMDSILYHFYANRTWQPVWISKEGLYPGTHRFIAEIPDLIWENIPSDSSLYHIVKSHYADFVRSQSYDNTKSLAEFEIGLSKLYNQIANALLRGTHFKENYIPKIIMPTNDTSSDLSFYLKDSLLIDSLSVLDRCRPSHPWYKKLLSEKKRLYELQASYDSLKDASGRNSMIRQMKILANISISDTSLLSESDFAKQLIYTKYQLGLKPDTILDEDLKSSLSKPLSYRIALIDKSIERLRWFKNDYQKEFVWVNIPQMIVEYFENDTVRYRMRAVVGRAARPTPVLQAPLTQIVLSPPWTVPPTILKNDVLPGVLRRGGSYLARKGLKAYDSRGRVVNASNINASNYRNYSYSQAPGYNSSLGEVKFNMPNTESVYMHDTPHREDFVKRQRALSSGCVRLQKPKEFASFLLNDTILYSYHTIDTLCKTRKTKFIPMPRKLMVYFAYHTAAVDSVGTVIYLPDIYGLDARMKMN